MTNEVDICNIALASIGVSPISSLEENSAQAKQCAVFYEAARDATLMAAPWGFASGFVVLTKDTELSFEGWEYTYHYPENTLLIRKVGTVDIFRGAPGEDFVVVATPTLDGSRVLSQIDGARAEVTYRVRKPALYDAAFISAFAWRLAAHLALPLRGDVNLQKQAFQNYMVLVDKAKALSLRQRQVTNDTGRNPYYEARR